MKSPKSRSPKLSHTLGLLATAGALGGLMVLLQSPQGTAWPLVPRTATTIPLRAARVIPAPGGLAVIPNSSGASQITGPVDRCIIPAPVMDERFVIDGPKVDARFTVAPRVQGLPVSTYRR